MRTPRVVVGPVDKVVPHLPVAIQRADAVPIPGDALAAKEPDAGLVLVAHRQRVVQPVVDVGVPEQRALQVDVHVAQARRVHDGPDVVRLVGEDHPAPAGRLIVAALLEGLQDGGRRVGAVGTRLHDARRLGENERHLECCRGERLAHGEDQGQEEECLDARQRGTMPTGNEPGLLHLFYIRQVVLLGSAPSRGMSVPSR